MRVMLWASVVIVVAKMRASRRESVIPERSFILWSMRDFRWGDKASELKVLVFISQMGRFVNNLKGYKFTMHALLLRPDPKHTNDTGTRSARKKCWMWKISRWNNFLLNDDTDSLYIHQKFRINVSHVFSRWTYIIIYICQDRDPITNREIENEPLHQEVYYSGLN